MKKFFLIASFACAAIVMTACEGPGLIVTAQPSIPTYERPGAPGADYVWTDGNWIVDNGHYVWHEGHWDRPHGNRTWHEGHWQRTRNGYYWKPGRWR